MAYAAVPAPSRRVEMWFDGPQQQRRWTVLIRIILAIPQLIILFFLEIAVLVLTIIGWFGALFMGRLPEFVHQFNSGFLRWYQRVYAYAYLLTDEYPPFELDDVPYPARPIVPSPGPLNRAAVFFRIILGIPAYFFQAIVSYGLIAPLLFVTWLIMIFTGRMPPPLYWAYSSLVRYQARLFAYMSLLTSEYPWGMLGDRGPEPSFVFAPATGPVAPAPGMPPPYVPPAPYVAPSPPTATATVDAAPSEEPESAPAASPPEPPREAAAPVPPPAAPAWPPPPPPGYSLPGTTPPPWGPAPPPPPPPGADANRSRLVLPRAARGWLIFAIVWGSILIVGEVSLQAAIVNNNANTAVGQYNTVVNDFNQSNAAIGNPQRRSCTTVSCLRPYELAVATSLDKFDSDLTSMNLPPNAQAPALSVESDLTQLATVFTNLANSPDAQAYRSTEQTSNLTTLLASLQNDTNSLLSALHSNFL